LSWEPRFFKGRQVWVEADTDGEPIVEDGRVSMKYDDEADAHIEIVQPMEFKGDTQKVRQYYCDVECLLEKVDD